MSRVTKGYTLLECIVAMALIDVILLLCASVFYTIYKDYNMSIVNSREYTYSSEAFRIIENEILSGNKKVDFSNDEIVLEPFNLEEKSSAKKNYITIVNNNLVIKYTTNGVADTSNVLMEDVKGFEIKSKQGTEIICITSEKGSKFYKCINTRFIQ